MHGRWMNSLRKRQIFASRQLMARCFSPDVLLVMFGHFGLLDIALMNVKAVAKRTALTRGDWHVSGSLGFFLEFVQAEGVGREKAIVAHMPRRRMTRIAWMIK